MAVNGTAARSIHGAKWFRFSEDLAFNENGMKLNARHQKELVGWERVTKTQTKRVFWFWTREEEYQVQGDGIFEDKFFVVLTGNDVNGVPCLEYRWDFTSEAEAIEFINKTTGTTWS